jgi:isopenicillin N synthase-like dioxygenase
VKRGKERVTQLSDAGEIAKLRQTAPDAKESMEIGNEDGEQNHYAAAHSPLSACIEDPVWRNYWPSPDIAPTFRSTMLQFYDICHDLHMDVLRAVAIGLGMEERFFDPLADGKWHTLRLLNYPPVSKKLLEIEGQARAGAHSGAS